MYLSLIHISMCIRDSNNTVASTYWMRKGNFIRFKTLELGYKFKYGRVYLKGDNIAVFSPFKLWAVSYTHLDVYKRQELVCIYSI